jgi:hypothetical protein
VALVVREAAVLAASTRVGLNRAATAVVASSCILAGAVFVLHMAIQTMKQHWFGIRVETLSF